MQFFGEEITLLNGVGLLVAGLGFTANTYIEIVSDRTRREEAKEPLIDGK